MSQSSQAEGPLLQVDGLAVTFYTPRGTVRAVRDASLEIGRGEVLGLVGESGCGKSTVAFALMGYLPGTARVDGTIRFAGRDISHLTPSELRQLRGNRMAMVYQDPATSLNPAMRVGPQIERCYASILRSTPGRRRSGRQSSSTALVLPTRRPSDGATPTS